MINFPIHAPSLWPPAIGGEPSSAPATHRPVTYQFPLGHPYVHWLDQAGVTGTLDAGFVSGPSAGGQFDVVKDTGGVVWLGRMNAQAAQFEALASDGSVVAKFERVVRGLGDVTFWQKVGQSEHWLEQTFDTNRPRYYLHAMDVALRGWLMDGCGASFRLAAQRLAPQFAACEVVTIKQVLGDLCVDWNALAEPTPDLALARLSSAAGSAQEYPKQVAVELVRSVLANEGWLAGGLRDLVARTQASRTWWQNMAQAESEPLRELSQVVAGRRSVEARAQGVRETMMASALDRLSNALSGHQRSDVERACELLALCGIQEHRLQIQAGLVPAGQAAGALSGEAVGRAIDAALRGYGPLGGLRAVLEETAGRLHEPALREALLALCGSKVRYARLQGEIRSLASQEIQLRRALWDARNTALQIRRAQNNQIFGARFQSLFADLPAHVGRAQMDQTLGEVLSCFCPLPEARWGCLDARLCRDTGLDEIVELVDLDQAAWNHFREVWVAPQNIHSVEAVRLAVYDQRLVEVELEALNFEQQEFFTQAQGNHALQSLDAVIAGACAVGLSPAFSQPEEEFGAAMRQSPELRALERERHAHYLQQITASNDRRQVVSNARAAILQQLRQHRAAGQEDEAERDVVEAMALVRAVLDCAGEQALWVRDVRQAAGILHRGADTLMSELMERVRHRKLEPDRDDLNPLAIDSLGWLLDVRDGFS